MALKSSQALAMMFMSISNASCGSKYMQVPIVAPDNLHETTNIHQILPSPTDALLVVFLHAWAHRHPSSQPPLPGKGHRECLDCVRARFEPRENDRVHVKSREPCLLTMRASGVPMT